MEERDFVEILIPLDNGTMNLAEVCQRHKLGWTTIARETKIEWPGPTMRCRDRNAVAYALICGPAKTLEQYIQQVAECAKAGLAAAGLAAIVSSPASALPAFKATFLGCLSAAIGNEIDKLAVNLEVKTEVGEWGKC